MNKVKSNKEKSTELIIMSTLLIISFFLWDTYFIYPIKLCVVLLHEISHALVILLSGGKIIGMDIGFNLGGKCISEGGNEIAIASSGYLGSLIFGTLLFISPNNKKAGFWILNIISLLIIILSSISGPNATLIILALLLAAILTTSSFYLRIPIISILVRGFGLIGSVYVLYDIKEDLFTSAVQISDASILSGIIDVPVIVIGLVWALVSILIIYTAMRISYK